MGQPQHFFDCARRQTRFAASPLRDRPDPGSSLFCEARAPAPHRFRSHLATSGYLGIGDSVAAHSKARAWTTFRCGSVVETAIRLNSARCSSLTDNAAATMHRLYKTLH